LEKEVNELKGDSIMSKGSWHQSKIFLLATNLERPEKKIKSVKLSLTYGCEDECQSNLLDRIRVWAIYNLIVKRSQM
jgi:hypothetical protein